MKKNLGLVAAATVLILTGCSTGTETVEDAASSQSMLTEESSQSAWATPQSSETTETAVEPAEAAEQVEPVAPDLESIAAGFEAPEPGIDAAVAWEALLGVDGEYVAYASYQAVIDEFGDV